MVFRRYVRADLGPKAYSHISVRIIIATILAPGHEQDVRGRLALGRRGAHRQRALAAARCSPSSLASSRTPGCAVSMTCSRRAWSRSSSRPEGPRPADPSRGHHALRQGAPARGGHREHREPRASRPDRADPRAPRIPAPRLVDLRSGDPVSPRARRGRAGPERAVEHPFEAEGAWDPHGDRSRALHGDLQEMRATP